MFSIRRREKERINRENFEPIDCGWNEEDFVMMQGSEEAGLVIIWLQFPL
jgi:hypothetical protein